MGKMKIGFLGQALNTDQRTNTNGQQPMCKINTWEEFVAFKRCFDEAHMDETFVLYTKRPVSPEWGTADVVAWLAMAAVADEDLVGCEIFNASEYIPEM